MKVILLKGARPPFLTVQGRAWGIVKMGGRGMVSLDPCAHYLTLDGRGLLVVWSQPPVGHQEEGYP